MSEHFNGVNGGGGRFILGALAGAVVGAGIGMLFAPKAGSAMRSQISTQAGTLADRVRVAYREGREQSAPFIDAGRAAADDWVEQGKDTYREATDAASRAVKTL